MHFKNIFALLAVILLLAIPVSATIPVSVRGSGSSYIEWTWPSGTLVTNESVDGLMINTFDSNANEFTLSNLQANESHTFCAYTSTTSGCNTAATLPDNSIPTQLAGLLVQWWYLALITLFIIIGMMRKMGFFLIVASVISLYALAAYLVSTPIQVTDIWHLPFFLYTWFFIFPFVLIYFKGGWLK